MLQVEVIDTSELGDRSYVAHDGTVAVVVDPQRDIDRVEAGAGRARADGAWRCWRPTSTTTTSPAATSWPARPGPTTSVNADDPVAFDREPVRDGDELHVGRMPVTRDRHPGPHRHPPGLRRRGRRRAEDAGGVHRRVAAVRQRRPHRPGRPGPHRGAHPRPVPLRAPARPSCPATTRGLPHPRLRQLLLLGVGHRRRPSTIAEERSRNDALTDRRRGHLRRDADRRPDRLPGLLRPHGRPEPAGPGPIDLARPSVSTPRSCASGSRPASGSSTCATAPPTPPSTSAAASASRSGSQFATYLGWLIPWGTPLTLIGESAEQVTDAQRQLVRIGIDRPDGGRRSARSQEPGRRATEPGRGLPAAHVRRPRRPPARRRPRCTVLDVRRDDERAQAASPARRTCRCTRCWSGSTRCPTGPLWVHCASGFRA